MGGCLITVSTNSHGAPATGMPLGSVIEDDRTTRTLAGAYEAKVCPANKVADTLGQGLQQLFGRVPLSPFAETQRMVGFRSAARSKRFLNLAVFAVGSQQAI